MAEQPAAATAASIAQDASPTAAPKTVPKAPQNPVFRMMGRCLSISIFTSNGLG